MGSWNETCGVTHMPIMEGDRVQLLLLQYVGKIKDDQYPQNHAGQCYANETWSPRALPFSGTYNDYGTIENWVESWNTHFICEGFQSDLVERAANPEKHEPGIRKSDVSIENIQTWIHKSKLHVKTYNGEQPVGFMMIKQEIYDWLVDQPVYAYPKPRTLDKTIQQGVQYYLAIMNLLETECADSSYEQKDTFMLLKSHKLESIMDHSNWFSRLQRSGGTWLDHYGMSKCLRDYDQLLKHHAALATPVEHPLIMELITELARYMHFYSNFSALRKTLTPQGGKGSQDQELKLMMELNTFTNQLAQAKLDWYEAEYGDEECDDEDDDENTD